MGSTRQSNSNNIKTTKIYITMFLQALPWSINRTNAISNKLVVFNNMTLYQIFSVMILLLKGLYIAILNPLIKQVIFCMWSKSCKYTFTEMNKAVLFQLLQLRAPFILLHFITYRFVLKYT